MPLPRASVWSVTINNPSQVDEYNIAQARQRGWKVEGQLEQGENGTPHYQLLVRTHQVRFSTIKTAFPRAHIEVARDARALQKYVHKDETRVASLQVDQSMYPSQLQLFDWFSLYYKQLKREYPKMPNLEIWDLMVRQKIQQGYMIGAEVMNPQIRAFIKRFGEAIVIRAENLKNNSMATTASQPPQEINIPSYNIQHAITEDQEQESTSIQEESDNETRLIGSRQSDESQN